MFTKLEDADVIKDLVRRVEELERVVESLKNVAFPCGDESDAGLAAAHNVGERPEMEFTVSCQSGPAIRVDMEAPNTCPCGGELETETFSVGVGYRCTVCGTVLMG